MTSTRQWTQALLTLAVGAVFLTSALRVSAQVQTQTSTSTGTPTINVSVERGEVVYVQGNDLMVKMQDGTLRTFHNVPESARVTVDGRDLGIHDLKVGMRLQKTVTTTTTPQIVTTVETVTGKVWHVSPPNTLILTLADGTNQQFTIPDGQQFNVEGQMVDASALRDGMTVSATKVVEEPATSVNVKKQLSGSMPPPPPPSSDMPILFVIPQ
jgi:hypothetical protein